MKACTTTKRDAEKRFFEKLHAKSYWSQIDKQRLGTFNLRQALSELLVQIIYRELPRIVKELREMKAQVEHELKQLPLTISGDYKTHLERHVSDLALALRCAVKASEGHNELINFVHARVQQFKDEIMATKPLLQKSSKEKDADLLDDLKQIIKSHHGRMLPAAIPYQASLKIIKEFVDKWCGPMDECADAIHEITEDFLLGLMVSHFSRFSHLQSRSRGIAIDELDKRAQQLLVDLRKEFQLQRADDLPGTLASLMLQESYGKYQESLWQEVRQDRIAAASESKKAQGLVPVVVLDQVPEPVQSAEDLNAIKVFAQAQAYFDVAAFRVCDQVVLHVYYFLKSFSEALPVLLRTELGYYSDDQQAALLLEEDAGVARRRKDLETELSRLRRGEKELAKLPVNFVDIEKAEKTESKQP